MRNSIKEVTSTLLFVICCFSLTFSQIQVGQDIPGDTYTNIGALSVNGNRVAFDVSSNIVRIYDWVDENWTQVGSDIELPIYSQSMSFSDNGNILAVGMPAYGPHLDEGLVQVYQLIDGDWVQMGGDVWEPSAYISDGNGAGQSVSLSSDGMRLAVGVPFPSSGGYDYEYSAGEVRIYDYVNGDWQEVVGFSGEDPSNRFGLSVSLSADGNRIAIGEPYDEYGQVKIYDKNNNWQQIGETIDGEVWAGRFGHSVSISADGNTVVVAGSGSHEVSGKVYNLVDDNWVKSADSLGVKSCNSWDCDAEVGIGAEGNRLIIHRLNDVYIYDLIGEHWIEMSALQLENYSAVALSKNGERLAIYNDVVKVYDLSGLTTSTSSVLPVDNNIQLSPIPSKDFIHVQFDTRQPTATIHIANTIGQIIHQETTTGTALQSKTFNIVDFQKGLYFLTIDDGENAQTKRFVKQ